jgi:hypothetical protein
MKRLKCWYALHYEQVEGEFEEGELVPIRTIPLSIATFAAKR